MQIFFHDVLDSTQNEARLLLQKKQSVPFAVQAGKQTSGRGQLGKNWESESSENLYLTLVLELKDTGDILKIPGFCSYVLAKFIREKHGLFCRLKWPNDLFFAAKKLAGILCESQIHSPDQANIFLGFGVNLNQAPTTSKLGYSATYLKDICSVDNISVKNWAKEFVEFFLEEWKTFGTLNWFTIYRSWLLPPGHVLIAPEGHYYITNYDEKGCLVIEDSKGAERIIQSAQEVSLRWDLTLPETRKLIFDIGNTRTKFAVFSAAGEILKSGTGMDWGDFSEAYYSSVKGSLIKTKNLFEIPKKRVRLAQSRYNLNELGSDRLCLIECFLETYFCGESGLLISAGTATTLDIIDSTGIHLGGYILPGFGLSAKVLHHHTGLLPEVQIEETKEFLELGVNTHDAIEQGLLNSTLTLVEKLCVEFKIKFVLLTGGDSKFYEIGINNIVERVVIDEYAVLKGAFAMLRG